jgi:hypothetical protein
MTLSDGASYRAKAQSTIELVGPLTWQKLLFLVSLGALTVLLHERFHFPLKMPGHHGLEAMALLTIGRLSCTTRWAATIVGLSTGATALAAGAGHGVADAGLDLAPGLCLDLFVLAFRGWRAHLLFLPALVAVAFATKPLIRAVLHSGLGLEFGSLKAGLLFPFSTHLLFGLTGAAVAAALWRISMRKLDQK